MKRIVPILLCVILIFSLSSCGTSNKYGNIIKYLDNEDYDSAILEIEKMKNPSADEELIALIKLAKGIYIYTDISSGSYTDKYSLTEELWVTPKNCEFVYQKNDSTHYLHDFFTTETFDEIIKMILNGNPKEHEPNVDSTGRILDETLQLKLTIRTKNEQGYNNYVALDCENIEEIYARFMEMRQSVSKGAN